MKILRISFALFLVVVAPVLFAQQGGPGGPPSVSAPTLFDSQGKQVGKLVDSEKPTSTTWVRYTLAGGDTVLLQATAGALTAGPTGLLYFFGSTDCSGPQIYISVGGTNQPIIAGGFGQLSKRQPLIVNRFSTSFTAASSILYVTDPLPVPVLGSGVPTSLLSTSGCRSTVLPDLTGVPLLRYQQVEDLSAKFTPPFWAQ